MNSATAKAAEQNADLPADPPFYLWKFQGPAVRIRIRLDVVRRIREYLTEGGPTRSEAGGLLIGKSDGPQAEITGFAPIFRDNEAGPHFVLSDREKTDLLRYIDGLNQGDVGRSVLGYFRSDIRNGISLHDEDQKLIKECFADPRNVFLVVQARETGPPAAGFFFWEDGSIFSSFSFMEFDFDETLLASEMYSVDAAAAPPPREDLAPSSSQIAEGPNEVPVPDRDPPDPPPSRRRRAIPAVIGAVLAVLMITGALFRFNQPARISGSVAPVSVSPAATTDSGRDHSMAPGRLGLAVTASGKDIAISWDAKSPLVTGARVALLTIDDGQMRRDVSLTKVQLMSSRLVYTRSTDTVQIALETFGEDGKVTRENVIAMSPTPPAVVGARIETRVSATAPAQPAHEKKTVREFVLPPSARASARPVITAPADAAGELTSKLDLRQIVSPTQGSPPVPVVTDTPFVAPAFPARSIQVVAQSPRRPAVPVQQVRPALPDNVKSMLTSRATVKVRMQVDATGRVSAAEPLVSGGSLNRFLGVAASSAARHWIFEPATEGDRKVASEFTVEFTFVPESTKR